MDLKGKRIELYFDHHSTKLTGECLEIATEGILLHTGDDGTQLGVKIVSTFIPWGAVKQIDITEPRSEEEQEAKKHELEEKFRRMTMESLAPPSSKNVELLEQEGIEE